MERGKLNIYTKMERKMLSDIRDLRRRRFDMEKVTIKDMKRTAH